MSGRSFVDSCWLRCVSRLLPLQVVSKLHNLLKPFMLRRLKADVEICLPRKQEVLLYAPMSEQQQTINSQLLEKTLGVRRRGGCCAWCCAGHMCEAAGVCVLASCTAFGTSCEALQWTLCRAAADMQGC
jgi:hypothetical protein